MGKNQFWINVYYLFCEKKVSKSGFENFILGSIVNLTKPPAEIINSVLL